jgi:ubiquinone/menaquinone biosynthesis C-methylase UbiE
LLVYRRLGSLLLVSALLAPFAGCKKKTVDCTLVLTLPESYDAKVRGEEEGKTRLTINGADFGQSYGWTETKKTVKFDTGGKDKATVVFVFWPNNYTKITRTRVVAVGKDKEVAVDFTKEDKDAPADHIKPIYYPTPPSVADAMCKMAKVGKGDVVMDIGCGDGRIVIHAVKEHGARKGIGIDINPDLVKLCRENAKKAGVADRVEFRVGDANNLKDVSEASVVLLYLGDHLNMKVRPALQKTLKPGSRVVSHRFKMGDWEPDKSADLRLKNNEGEDEDYVLHLWTIKPKKKAAAPPSGIECTLVLTLPESGDARYRDEEEGKSKLIINGVSYGESYGWTELKRNIIIDTGGKDRATIVCVFWPNNYTRITRTRVVAVAKDKEVAVDLTSPDPKSPPDHVKPIYYPTPVSVARAMCKMAKVTKGDVVMDIGCGDGRLVIQAVKEFGARKGIGIDINPDLIKKCKENAKKAGVADKVEFRLGDANKITDVSEANVVLLYLGEDLNLRLRPALQKTLKPGSRVVSHRFKMGDWEPDRSERLTLKNNDDEDEAYRLHLWTIKPRK